MKPVFAVFVTGVCLVVLGEAFPSSKEHELQSGIPTSLLEVENQQLSEIPGGEEQSSLAREKRHKKKVVVINQYYTRPGHGGYGHQGGYGWNGGYQGGHGGHGGYQGGYGWNGGYQGGYGGYGGYQGVYGGYGGHGHGHKKFKG